jgi:uncharacterized protein YbjT (DUF2867 family)
MILVSGATGVLGGMITRRLLEQDREVRILARPQSDYRSLEEAGAQVAMGNLTDPSSLDRALEGVEVVITTANSAARGGEDNVQTVEIEGNRNLIDAARRAGVKQFVFVSAIGASPDAPSEFLRGKAAAEEHLRSSGIPYTILAPNMFMEIWIGMIVGAPVQSGQPVRIVGEGRRKHSLVSIADVAAYAVAAVDNPAALGQYIPIGGPVALSWTEIVDTAGRVLGRSLALEHLTPGESLPGLPDVVSQLMAGMDTYDSPIEMDRTAHTFGVIPTPVEVYLQRMKDEG